MSSSAPVKNSPSAPARNYTLDIMRIVAIIFVVICHSSGSLIFHHQVAPGTSWFQQCVALNGITRWDVPFFVMLTGFFMLDPKKSVPVKTLYSKNLLRILVALVFWSLFYGLTLHRPLYPLGTQEGHLWYLGMIIGVYIAIPVLRLVAQNQSLLKYFSLAWVAVMCYKFVGNFATLPVDLNKMIFVEFSGYVVFSYYLRTLFHNQPETPRLKTAARVIYVVGLVGFIFTVAMGLVMHDEETYFYSFSSPNVLATATAVMVFCIRHPLHPTGKIAALIENCSKCTFGIYLIHVWVLAHILNRIHRFLPQPILMTIVCVIAAFAISYAITFVLKKIPFVQKYLV